MDIVYSSIDLFLSYLRENALRLGRMTQYAESLLRMNCGILPADEFRPSEQFRNKLKTPAYNGLDDRKRISRFRPYRIGKF